MRIIVVTAALAALCSCVTEEATAPQSFGDGTPSCESIADRVQGCLETAEQDGVTPSQCAPIVDELEAMCPGGKADWVGDWLCSVGILRHCETPTCEVSAAIVDDDCASLIDADGCAACDYYTCREAAAGDDACGASGYYLDFGYRYCERLSLVARPRMSAAGQRFVDDTRRCLMTEIEMNVEDEWSCGQLKGFAFDSHPGCYVGANFCSLPFSDWWLVLTTIDPADRDLRQMLTTGIGCLFDW